MEKQIQELLKKGETAKAYQKAKVLLSKQELARQIDQMADMAELSASQIQANNAMNRMTAMMASSSKTMNAAQKNMNPERVCNYPLSRRFGFSYFLTRTLFLFRSADSRGHGAVQDSERRVRHVEWHLSGCYNTIDVRSSVGGRRA